MQQLINACQLRPLKVNWSRLYTNNFVYFVVLAVILQMKRRVIDENMEFDMMLQVQSKCSADVACAHTLHS